MGGHEQGSCTCTHVCCPNKYACTREVGVDVSQPADESMRVGCSLLPRCSLVSPRRVFAARMLPCMSRYTQKLCYLHAFQIRLDPLPYSVKYSISSMYGWLPSCVASMLTSKVVSHHCWRLTAISSPLLKLNRILWVILAMFIQSSIPRGSSLSRDAGLRRDRVAARRMLLVGSSILLNCYKHDMLPVGRISRIFVPKNHYMNPPTCDITV